MNKLRHFAETGLMLHNNLLTLEYLLLALKGRDVMETFTTIIVAICMILYAVYAIWQICQFERLISGAFGTTAVIAGGIGMYFVIAPLIAAIIVWLLQLLGVIVVIAILFSIAGE